MSMYEKRRRIVHNQALILALAILCNFLSFPIIPSIVFFLYDAIPEIFVPAVLISWGITAVFTAIVDGRVLYRKWKERHGYEDETDYSQKSRRKEEKHTADKSYF